MSKIFMSLSLVLSTDNCLYIPGPIVNRRVNSVLLKSSRFIEQSVQHKHEHEDKLSYFIKTEYVSATWLSAAQKWLS
jgi:hypothetical protein